MSNAEKTYNVEGMTCGHCELSVGEAVAEIDGVTWAQADHTTGRLTVRGQGVNDADVEAAVAEAGYVLRSADPSS